MKFFVSIAAVLMIGSVSSAAQSKDLFCRLEEITFDSAGNGHNQTLKTWNLGSVPGVYRLDEKVGDVKVWINGDDKMFILQLIKDGRSSSGTWKGVGQKGFFAALDINEASLQQVIKTMSCFTQQR